MNASRANVRDSLLEAALWFVQAAAQLSEVQRIVLIGSILSDRQSPERRRPTGVRCRRCRSRTAGGTPAPRAAPEPEPLCRRILGRRATPVFGSDLFLEVVPARDSRLSDALHCGRRPHLHDDLATIRLPDSLIAAPPLELWPIVVRRCQVPADVERLVSRLHEPHNNALEQTAHHER
jgi:hypothetical protein